MLRNMHAVTACCHCFNASGVLQLRQYAWVQCAAYWRWIFERAIIFDCDGAVPCCMAGVASLYHHHKHRLL